MNIKILIKKYIVDFLSFLLLIGAIVFFVVNVFYNPLLQYNKTIEILSASYTKEELQLFGELNKVQKTEVVEATGLDAVPSFLIKVSDICKNANILITTLKQNGETSSQFELQFTSSYFSFLSILSELERANIVINKIDIKPFELQQEDEEVSSKEQGSLQHIVTLNISAINDGERLSKKDLEFLDDELFAVQKRDPFKRFTKVNAITKTNKVVDLTWIYQLSGIGKVDGEYVATIDHKMYFKGDVLNQMKIKSINSNSVLFEKSTPSGVVNFSLNFRIKTESKVSNEK